MSAPTPFSTVSTNGKTHIHAWYAILAVGLVAGLASGVIWVTNRSGDVEKSDAQKTAVSISAVSDKIPLYFSYHIGSKEDPPFNKNNSHQWVDAAIINSEWREAHTGPGTFDWALLDRKIADWTHAQDPADTRPPAKKVIIRVTPYGQNPLGKRLPSCPDCNDITPPWVYGKGVPKITFVGGGTAGGDIVTVPQAWHENFYPVYDEFLKALGEKYNSDARVAGFSIGFGHLDTWNAQASRNGGKAFQSEPFGWTLATWEEHTKRVMDSADRYIKKPLMFRAPAVLLDGFKISEANAPFETAKHIVQYAVSKHFSVLFSALGPELSVSVSTGKGDTFIAPLARYIASLSDSAPAPIGFMDDWPLWDPSPKGPTKGRTAEGFENELKFVSDLRDVISANQSSKVPVFLVFQEPEACATNENSINQKHRRCVEYQNDPAASRLRAIAEKYLFAKMGVFMVR